VRKCFLRMEKDLLAITHKIQFKAWPLTTAAALATVHSMRLQVCGQHSACFLEGSTSLGLAALGSAAA